MRVFLDACVLVPTLTRGLLLDAARAGALVPLWSDTVFAEWRHAAARCGPVEALAVETEITLMKARFATGACTADPAQTDALDLPDPDDRHVLAAALAGQAKALVTFNERDFPLRIMAAKGILRRNPDGVLLELCEDPALQAAMRARLDEAMAATGRTGRALLKAAQLPRLGKFLFPTA